MSELAVLGLAGYSDALEIAEMSRDLIEHGLSWSWTPARVRRAILGRDCCVLAARREGKIAGDRPQLSPRPGITSRIPRDQPCHQALPAVPGSIA